LLVEEYRYRLIALVGGVLINERGEECPILAINSLVVTPGRRPSS
jgi:hypothetical protein